MNNYPNDILVGVSPAVFALNLNASDDVSSDSNNTPFYRLLNSMTAAGSTNSDEQLFWNRARIFPITNKHEFPKSKKSVESDYSAKALRGILKEGWLEKHTRALPSVMLVAFEISKQELLEFEAAAADLEQSEDKPPCVGKTIMKRLVETIWDLRRKLEPNKRECKLFLTCIITGSDSESFESSGVQSVRIEEGFYLDNRFLHEVCNRCRVSGSHLSVLHSHHLEGQGTPDDSSPLRILLKNVRESSVSYYLNAARKAKRKERDVTNRAVYTSSTSFLLGDPSNVVNKELITLIIRYNFKVAVFYEFVGNKQEKCIKYYADSYLALEKYFCYIKRNRTNLVIPASKSTVETFVPDAGVEVFLTASPGVRSQLQSETDVSRISMKNKPMRATDMIFQCQAVAAWINLKIIRLGLGPSNLLSRDSKNVGIVAKQCMRHERIFLRSFDCNSLTEKTIEQPKWHFLSYAAHQRLLIAQLSERINFEKKHDSSSVIDDIDMQFSPWRNYATTAETTLLLYQELKNVSASSIETANNTKPSYVGSVSLESLSSKLSEENNINHIGLALEYVQRALQFYEKEKIHSKISQKSGSRLFYLAGRLLIMLRNWDMAAKYLYDAYLSAKDWLPVKLVVGKAMIECLMNLDGAEKYTHVLSELLFDPMANKLLPRTEMEQMSTIIFNNCTNNSIKFQIDSTSPFSFEVAFSDATAEIGDSVKLLVEIRSHLQTSFYIHSSMVSLKHGVAELLIPNGVIHMGPFETHRFDAILVLAGKNLEDFSHAYRQSSRMRPYSSGLTIAGGCVASKKPNVDIQNSVGLSRLGGIPIFAVGLKMDVSNEKQSTNRREIHIFQKDYIDLKFTQSENLVKSALDDYLACTGRHENDYLTSTWQTGASNYVQKHPRCLRVHSPLPFLEVTDVSSSSTMGTAFDGGFYRVVIQIKAGNSEWCKNLTMMVEAKTSVLTTEEIKDDKDRTSSSQRSAIVALPVHTNSQLNDYVEGPLPVGWMPFAQENYPILDLSPGQTALLHFDLYMPAKTEPYRYPENEFLRTEYFVTLNYKQQCNLRPEECDNERWKTVSFRHFGSVVWKSPLGIDFIASDCPKLNFPNGATYPTNLVEPLKGDEKTDETNDSKKDLLHFPDKQYTNVRCVFFPLENVSNANITVSRVTFKATNKHVTVGPNNSLCNGNDESELYVSETNQPLTGNSRLSTSYLLYLDSKSMSQDQELQTDLGSVVVRCKPLPIQMSSELKAINCIAEDSFKHMLGPLPVSMSYTFKSPPIVLHQVPFSVVLKEFPVSPRLSTPFDVTYLVTNLSNSFQQLMVKMNESRSLLFSSLEHGEVSIAPNETMAIGYTAIPLVAGKIDLPGISVSSSRSKSWVINDSGSRANTVFVLP